MGPRIAGILNVTPDSFSDGGLYDEPGAAIRRAEQLLRDGADIIDVGGESTRPGARPVGEAEELRRVLPVVEALAGRCEVSVDTTKESVARACIKAGASILNDVSAELYTVAADLGAGWIATHKRGTPATMQDDPGYDDVLREVTGYLVDRAEKAKTAGVTRLWIDPGLGFGKRPRHDYALLRGVGELVATGFPVCVGASRKSFIGHATGQTRPERRVPGSVVAAAWSAAAGADLIRVHDVRATLDGLRVASAITGDTWHEHPAHRQP
ncbi:dihydropteroate synthase [Amycolatopsis sp., V23-08]|uniref:Dihydropteroate synthase n=1 Tax=Amycolatopsis heterodermiae TaxID=3110235 RepID=A0ABU5RAD7_9PSEU|nr:dihydropteroate synthase [Amycolatopsis sp., V23-08]MEA5362604.1 dihydropteroate synthase [Amycolatopsis sp., V23-08]